MRHHSRGVASEQKAAGRHLFEARSPASVVDFLLVGTGPVLVLTGGVALINHPFVDKFNRVVKSLGTKQSATDIEMSVVSITTGRIAGAFITLFGVGVILGGL